MVFKVYLKYYIDPWRWASLQKSDNPDIVAKVINC